MRTSSGDQGIGFFIYTQFGHEGDPIVVELVAIVGESSARVAILVGVVVLHDLAEKMELLETVEALLAHNLFDQRNNYLLRPNEENRERANCHPKGDIINLELD